MILLPFVSILVPKMGDAVPYIVPEHLSDHSYSKPIIRMPSAPISPHIALASYLASNPVFTSPAESVVVCTACDHSFYNVPFSVLDKHLSTNKHLINVQWSADEIISKNEFRLASTLIRTHRILERDSKTSIKCKLCGDKVFVASQFGHISRHIRAKHSKALHALLWHKSPT